MWSRLRQAKKKNVLSLVRKGVYLPTDIENKFVIGCNAVDSGVICYHSALEYYLLQTQEFNELFIHSDKAFRSFEYLGERYSYKKLKFLYKPVYVSPYPSYSICVTSLSQTLVDCIYNINLAGGIEELIYALSECNASNISEKEVLACLKLYNNKSLWQRAGFLFSVFGTHLGFSDNFFEACKSKMGNNQSYLINPYFCNSFNKEWNLCIPSDIKNQVKIS